MSGRPEFVPGGQYILWMVNFALDFVQIAVFCQSISLWVRFSVFPVMSFLIRQCHDALTVGAKGFFAGTWLFSVSWDGDFCCFFFFCRIVSCKSAICTSWSCSNLTGSIFLFCSPLMFSWRIFSSSLAYFSQGAGDRTPLRGPFSPR